MSEEPLGFTVDRLAQAMYEVLSTTYRKHGVKASEALSYTQDELDAAVRVLRGDSE